MKKIAFKPHETRGQEIIKIFKSLGFRNPMNYDGIASDKYLNKAYVGGCEGAEDCIIIDNISYLERVGYKIYTLEEYENEYKGMIPIEVTTVEKTAREYAVDILTKKKDCYFDDLDVDIVAEAYMAGYKDAINKRIW